jgi:hypothetical protein
MYNIVRVNEADVDSVRFDNNISKTKKGGKMIKLKEPLKLQTPPLILPFGVSEFKNDATGTMEYKFAASLEDNEDDVLMLKNFIEGLSKKTIEHCKKHCRDLFGSSTTPDQVPLLFKSPIKEPSKPEYAPLLNIKTTDDTKYFDRDENPLEVENFKGGRHQGMFIINITSVWFVGRSFGISLKAIQVMQLTTPFVASQTGCAFVRDSDLQDARKRKQAVHWNEGGDGGKEDNDEEEDATEM